MSDASKNLARLLPLLEMAYQAEQQKMAKILNRINTLREKLHALERPNPLATSEINVATLAGADILWESWVQDRKILINRELALAFRDREAAKESVVKALSKFEATKQVERRVRTTAERTRERRSSW
jgi:hypothetical protein